MTFDNYKPFSCVRRILSFRQNYRPVGGSEFWAHVTLPDLQEQQPVPGDDYNIKMNS